MSKLQSWLILLYQSLPLHHSPGSWLVVSWQAASGSSGNCITVTAGNHHPHIGEQGRVLVFRQQFWSTLRFFTRKKRAYCLAIRTKHERGFSTSSRATVFSRLKLVWAVNLCKNFFCDQRQLKFLILTI